MNNVNYFKDLFESTPDYRKIVLIVFLYQKDKTLIKETGFNKKYNNLLNFELENILIEQHEEYLDYVKNEAESIIEKVSKK